MEHTNSNGKPQNPLPGAHSGGLHPALEHVHPSLLLPVENDLRDRNAPDYLDYFHNRLVPDVRQRGILVPVIAYREGGKLRVLDGETRRLAALLAPVESLPAMICEEKPDDANLKLAQLLCNSMRRDMRPLELAAIYSDLLRINSSWTQADLARAVRVSPAQVAKVLAISGKLHPDVQALVAAGKLPPGSAYAISRLPMPQQLELARKAAELPMAVESVEEAVIRMLGKKPPKAKPIKAKVDGALLMAPGEWTWEKLKDLAERLKAAALRGEKMGAPLALLPGLLKG